MATGKGNDVSLDDILFNLKSEPYTLHQYYLYSEKAQAVELLDFWITAQDLRNMYEPEHPRSSYSMNNWDIDEDEEEDDIKPKLSTLSVGSEEKGSFSDAKTSAAALTLNMRMSRKLTETLNAKRSKPKKIDLTKYAEAQMMVVACYIAEDAPLEVNISYDMRKKILARAPKSDTDPPTKGLFDDAQTECEKLMQTNQYPKFKKQADIAAGERKFEARPPPRPRPISIMKGKGPAPLPDS